MGDVATPEELFNRIQTATPHTGDDVLRPLQLHEVNIGSHDGACRAQGYQNSKTMPIWKMRDIGFFKNKLLRVVRARQPLRSL